MSHLSKASVTISTKYSSFFELHDRASQNVFYLMEMAGTPALQELFISSHSDAECVNDLISKMFGVFQNILVHMIEFLDSALQTTNDDDEVRQVYKM